MRARRVAGAAELARLVAPLLARDPVGHTVLATSLQRAQREPAQAPPDVLWWVAEHEAGVIQAAGQHWPPYRFGLQGAPDGIADQLAVATVALALAEGREPAGVVGPPAAAHAFGREWTRRTGDSVRRTRGQRLHVLDELVDPPPVRGRPRAARVDETDLVVAWWDAFQDEAIAERTVESAQVVRPRLVDGTIHLWTVDDVPVALAARNPAVAGVARVGPVYTPPEHRRLGYGGAVTAAATRAALAAGARDVCLYTDLANPTSNALYARLGFRPVGDEVELSFSSSVDDPSGTPPAPKSG